MIYRVIKAGLATMDEMNTIITFDELQKMNAYLSMEGALEAAIGKALMPKVGK